MVRHFDKVYSVPLAPAPRRPRDPVRRPCGPGLPVSSPLRRLHGLKRLGRNGVAQMASRTGRRAAFRARKRGDTRATRGRRGDRCADGARGAWVAGAPKKLHPDGAAKLPGYSSERAGVEPRPGHCPPRKLRVGPSGARAVPKAPSPALRTHVERQLGLRHVCGYWRTGLN